MSTSNSGRPEECFTTSIELSFDRAVIERIQHDVARELAMRDFDQSAAFAVRLAIEEAIVNGFRHGNENDPSKTVAFECRIDPDSIEVEVRDQGVGFNPESVPDPTDEQNLETPSGRGIMLMRAYMSEVEYVAPGNIVRMAYRRKPSPTS